MSVKGYKEKKKLPMKSNQKRNFGQNIKQISRDPETYHHFSFLLTTNFSSYQPVYFGSECSGRFKFKFRLQTRNGASQLWKLYYCSNNLSVAENYDAFIKRSSKTNHAGVLLFPSCLSAVIWVSQRQKRWHFDPLQNVQLLDKNRTNAFWDTPTTTGLSPKTGLCCMSSHINTQARPRRLPAVAHLSHSV